MNDLYNKTIEYDGKIYHYDPESDTFYRRYSEDMSTFDKWSPIIIIAILSVIALFLEIN
jgi:hypothetical protein